MRKEKERPTTLGRKESGKVLAKEPNAAVVSNARIHDTFRTESLGSGAWEAAHGGQLSGAIGVCAVDSFGAAKGGLQVARVGSVGLMLDEVILLYYACD